MRKKRATIWKRVLAVALAVAMLPVQGVQPAKAAEPEKVYIEVTYRSDGQQLIDQINQYRERQSGTVQTTDGAQTTSPGAVVYKELTYDPGLEAAAMQRAAEVALVYREGTRPDNSNVSNLYGSSAASENIGMAMSASGDDGAQAICAAWESAPSKKANMLSQTHQKIGVGHVVFQGYEYWVAAFSDQPCITSLQAQSGTKQMGIAYSGSMSRSLKIGSLGSTLDLNVGGVKDFGKEKATATAKISGHVPTDAEFPVVLSGVTLKVESDNDKIVSVDGTQIRAVAEGSTKVRISYGAYETSIDVKVSRPSMTISTISDQNYTGYEIRPAVKVSVGGSEISSSYYTVTYQNNIQKGNKTAVVIVRGTGAYSGYEEKAYFSIVSPTVANATVAPIPDQTFTGSALYPTLTVYESGRVLQQGIDYNVTYTNNINKGTATVIISGMGTYSGTKNVTFNIVGPSLYSATIDAIPDQLYTGSNIMPTVTVRLNNMTLIQNVDYTVNYQNNRNVGTAMVTVNGRGNYTGSRSATFRIIDRDISYAALSSIPNQRYTGNEIRPSVVVTLGGTVLRENVDYTLVYQNNRQPGTATVIVYGAGLYKGSKSTTFKITQTSLSSASVKVSDQTYNGNEKEPAVTVRLNGDRLEEGEDFEVEYRNNVKPGKATVVIYGMGYYSGTKKTTFVIKPKKQNLKSAKAKGKEASLSWTKDSNVKGYEIYRSKKKSSGYKRIGTFTTNKTTACRNTNLARGTYYYKVRSYIVVDGKKYYGAYSNVRSVKIR